MGYKVVCLDCRKAFNQGSNSDNFRESACPDCGKKMVFVNHKFKPPKKTDAGKWETVSYLIENGFYYQHIYEDKETKNNITQYSKYVSYPENMKEASEFVEKYKSQAIVDKKP